MTDTVVNIDESSMDTSMDIHEILDHLPHRYPFVLIDRVLSMEIGKEITALKNQLGQDIIAYGGGNFVSDLIKHNLIDEYHFFINPTLLGNGMTIFKSLEDKLNLQLIESKGFECGIVVLCYEPKKLV